MRLHLQTVFYLFFLLALKNNVVCSCVFRISYSLAGRRMSMEDTHVTIDDLFSVFPGLPPLPAPRAYYGVYDGHGGKQTADMVKEALHKILVNDPGFRDASDVVGALMRAYEEMDKKVLLASKDRVFTSGATAVTVVVVGNKSVLI